MLNRNKLQELLKNHDWYYQYSDDFSVYTSGTNEVNAIHKIIRNAGDKQNEALALYNSECPEGYEISPELYYSWKIMKNLISG